MKTLTIVSDEESNECLYIGGTAWESRGEVTVYAIDIAKAAGDESVQIRFVSVDGNHHGEWPETLEAALNLK